MLDKIDHFFQGQNIVEKADIASFLKEAYPKFDSKNLFFYFYDLRKSGLFFDYDATRFRRVGSLKQFYYLPDSFEKKIFGKGLDFGRYFSVCIYSSAVYNDFISLQMLRKYYFIEVPREAFDSTVQGISSIEKEYPIIFQKDFSLGKMLWSEKDTIIIRPFIMGSPLLPTFSYANKSFRTISSFPGPSIEKILIDSYCDDKVLNLKDTGDVVDVYHNVLADYMVNFRTLFSYAKKRNCWPEISDFIRAVIRFNIDKGAFFDD